MVPVRRHRRDHHRAPDNERAKNVGSDSIASAMRAWEWPAMPAANLAPTRTAFTPMPRKVARSPRDVWLFGTLFRLGRATRLINRLARLLPLPAGGERAGVRASKPSPRSAKQIVLRKDVRPHPVPLLQEREKPAPRTYAFSVWERRRGAAFTPLQREQPECVKKTPSEAVRMLKRRERRAPLNTYARTCPLKRRPTGKT